MKELPILFSTPMVQALLEGRKTMTRRIIKQKTGTCMFCGCTDDNCKGCIERTGNPCSWINDDHTICSACDETKSILKSKYQKGDLLWVRESFNITDPDDCIPGEYLGIETGYVGSNNGKDIYWKSVYKASSPESHPSKGKCRWKPSIHMPKTYARIWLKVTDVKVERLKDISTNDALNEGIKPYKDTKDAWVFYCPELSYTKKELELKPVSFTKSERHSFFTLWASIHGLESMNLNPWVWVYSFEILSTNGKPQNL